MNPLSGDISNVSIVIPVYNERKYLVETLRALERASVRAEIRNLAVIIVDDGSTDGTLDCLTNFQNLHISQIRQSNKGRYLARKNGIEKVQTPWTVLLDSRTQIGEGALRFLLNQIETHAERRVWNGHIEIDPNGSIYTLFWDFITKFAWKQYYTNTTLRSATSEDIEFFPRGTTLFATETRLLANAALQFDSKFENPLFVSDDTLLISKIVEQTPIWYSDSFGAVYFGRSTLRTFVSHTFGRGTRFVDSYFHRTSRYFFGTLLAIPLVPMTMIWATLNAPITLVAYGVGAIIVLIQRKTTIRSSCAFLILLPLFVAVYHLGIIRGCGMLIISRFSQKINKT